MLAQKDVIGKPVRERYGRFTGVVVAFESNLLGEVTAIVYDSNGLLVRTESNSFVFNGEAFEIAPSVLIESRNLCEQMRDLLVRVQALKKLRSNGRKK